VNPNDTWHAWQDVNYSNGAAHGTWLLNETAEYRFSGTSVIWVTEKGNPMGIAKVLIDGVDKGNFDLYSATAQNKVLIRFTDLTNTKHTIKIKVLGQKNPAAVSSYVFVDAFLEANGKVEDSSPLIKWNSWGGRTSANATATKYRMTRTTGAVAEFVFTGTSVQWITTTSPVYGKAEVFIDNVSKGVVDLYAPNQTWQVKKSYGGLSNATQSLEIHVLGQQNPAATNSLVVVDGFIYQ
jgi:hypothetical protein